MRVVILGAGGQLATDLAAALAPHDVHTLTRAQLDITDGVESRRLLTAVQPDVVLNTAAFHAVDRCETEPEDAFMANAVAPQRLAAICRDLGARFVHISTDYVFSGEEGRPYRESDPVAPVSVYGASKAAGEMAVRATSDDHLIVRVSGLFGHRGMVTAHGNFVETMLRLAARGGPLTVVSDQTLSPTYTPHAARAIADLLEREVRGTVHVTSSGEATWYEFARAIFRLARLEVEVRPIAQADWPVPARRPRYSVLAHGRLAAAGITEPPTWLDGLEEYLRTRPE